MTTTPADPAREAAQWAALLAWARGAAPLPVGASMMAQRAALAAVAKERPATRTEGKAA